MLVHRELSLGQALQPEEPSPEETTPSPPAEGTGILSRFISELELSVRARKCIQLLGAVTVGDLVAHSEAELMATKNFGHTSLSEIQRQLAQFGLTLRE